MSEPERLGSLRCVALTSSPRFALLQRRPAEARNISVARCPRGIADLSPIAQRESVLAPILTDGRVT